MDLSNLTLLELQHLIVLCRAHRGNVTERKIALEEKRRLGWDGVVEEAILACENELHVLNGVVSKLWMLELDYLKKQ
jgi:hypothetical protein